MSIKFAKLTNGTWGVRVYNEPGTREPGQTVMVTKSDGTQVEKVLFEMVERAGLGPTELWSTTDARPVYAARSFGGGRRPRVAPAAFAPIEVRPAPAAPAPIDVTVEGRTMTVESAEPPTEPAPVETDGGFARLLAKPIRDYDTAVRLGVRS